MYYRLKDICSHISVNTQSTNKTNDFDYYQGWGSLLVPVPAYHLVSLSDIEASSIPHSLAL